MRKELDRPFTRHRKVDGSISFDTSIWGESEFRALSATAQWVYLWRVIRPDRATFRLDDLRNEGGMSEAEIVDVIAELMASRYRAVVIDRQQREWIPPTIRREVYARDNWRCGMCGAVDDLSIDHIFPISMGGRNEPSNYQTLCRPCNSRKGNRIEDY